MGETDQIGDPNSPEEWGTYANIRTGDDWDFEDIYIAAHLTLRFEGRRGLRF